jgi:hypothetical protein
VGADTPFAQHDREKRYPVNRNSTKKTVVVTVRQEKKAKA